MKRLIIALALLAPAAAHAQTPAKDKPAPIVFFDLAGPDAPALAKFYSTVFDWSIAADGRFSVPIRGPALGGSAGLDATLRQDPKDKILYIGVPDITATMSQIVANGGKVVYPRSEVKGVVVLGLFTDPAGNTMGLVELDGDKAKIP